MEAKAMQLSSQKDSSSEPKDSQEEKWLLGSFLPRIPESSDYSE